MSQPLSLEKAQADELNHSLDNLTTTQRKRLSMEFNHKLNQIAEKESAERERETRRMQQKTALLTYFAVARPGLELYVNGILGKGYSRARAYAGDIVQEAFIGVLEWLESDNEREFYSKSAMKSFVITAIHNKLAKFFDKSFVDHEFLTDKPGANVSAELVNDTRLFQIPLTPEDQLIFQEIKAYFLDEVKLGGRKVSERFFDGRKNVNKDTSMRILRSDIEGDVARQGDIQEGVEILKKEGYKPFKDYDLSQASGKRKARENFYKMRHRILAKYEDELQRLEDEVS